MDLSHLENLSDEQLWDVLAAFRGPDMHSTAVRKLKDIITSRIRCYIMPSIQHDPFSPCIYGIYTNAPLTAGDLRAVQGWLLELELSNDYPLHWIQHLITAVEITRRDPIWGGHGNELTRILYNHLNNIFIIKERNL